MGDLRYRSFQPNKTTYIVVDLEFTIWGHPARLNRTKICSDDVATRKLVGEVNGPHTGSGAEVEDFLDVGRDRCEVELAVQRFGEEVVREVKVLVGLFVVGTLFVRL